MKKQQPGPPIEHIDVPLAELKAALARSRQAPITEEDYRRLDAALDTLGQVTALVAEKDTTIRDLRQLLFPASSEKTATVLKQAGLEPTPPARPKEDKAKPPGHGRKAARDYTGARRVKISHPTLKASDLCPACEQGKVYVQPEAKVVVRVVGQAPLAATVYEMERLRCNLCGEIFPAPAPAEAGAENGKYDATAVAMMAALPYGHGMPLNRLESLEAQLGIPLAASTQWEEMAALAEKLAPVHEELIRQAAQGEVLHNDDTSLRVLALPRQRQQAGEGERTGVFTSGIVSIEAGRRIALFFTGAQHAGENLADVLKQRAAGLAPPIQMCDALSWNVKKPPDWPEELQRVIGHCLAHGRRRFAAVVENFPEACQYVLEQFRIVYVNDAKTKELSRTREQRLSFHQEHSQPVMDQLKQWLEAQFSEKRVEPNSGLGAAITYLLKHWTRLTLFLRQAGAPLDNNVCERALKKAILHRKNSLFYKTQNGADVGDLFMSLIHTCELNGANPFDYLTELPRHAEELTRNPAAWMPWNYRDTLARLAIPVAA
jgi:transposase